MKGNDKLYDRIGLDYNSTRQADPYITERIFHLLSPEKNKLYLDIGCGTGNYTIKLSDKGFDFWGIDPSAQMLNEAKSKSGNIKWLEGSSERIPAEDEAFDGVIASLTIHHWSNLEKSFEELFRVMKPGSKFILFTSTPEQMKGYWLNHYFPEILKRAADQMPPFEKVKMALKEAGFKISTAEKYYVKEDLKDYFLYSGKYNPQLYFDPMIRNGISSFADVSFRQEIENGLKLLTSDIETNKFIEISDRFRNDHGDYLFIVVEKINGK